MAALPAILGYNFAFWALIGFFRFVSESLSRFGGQKKTIARQQRQSFTVQDVAVIMAAHNEERVLSATLAALLKNLPASQICIGSDASSDRTVEIARAHGCRVLDLHPNRGKAKTLATLLRHFAILEQYPLVLLVDAEIIVSDTYVATILPFFNDPTVVAFVSHAHSRWHQHWRPRWSMFFTAYRIRLWFMLYYGLRYGQTWKYTSATPIVPGGSSMYRSSAVAKMEIDTPGLIIEDFHMTFQIHHQRLGRIASHPSAWIIDQEPYNYRDYCQQVYRWYLGFWQTFFHHGYWTGAFWFATALFALEMVFVSMLMLTLPFLIIVLVFTSLHSFPLFSLHIAALNIDHVPVTLSGILVGAFVLDYATTGFTAVMERKPALLFYGLGFYFLRYVDTVLFLWTLLDALFSTSTRGTWKSPDRKV